MGKVISHRYWAWITIAIVDQNYFQAARSKHLSRAEHERTLEVFGWKIEITCDMQCQRVGG